MTSKHEKTNALLDFTDDLRAFADDLAFISDALSCLIEEFSTLDESSQSGAKRKLEQLKTKANLLAVEIRVIQEDGR